MGFEGGGSGGVISLWGALPFSSSWVDIGGWGERDGEGNGRNRDRQGERRGLPRESYRPVSKAGEARGESSAVMVKMPSNLRSG